MLSRNRLIRLIDQSFALDESTAVIEKHLAELEAKDRANSGKFRLK